MDDAVDPANALATAPVPMLRQIAHLCTSAFAEYCAIYLRGAGALPVATSSKEGRDTAFLDDAPYDDMLKERFEAAGFRTVVIEPLIESDRPLGTLVLGMENALGSMDRGILTALSAILSTVVEQARELAHHYRVSNRLQQALLPTSLASGDGLSFDAAYRPADDEAEVGGDWYDAFDLGNGTIGVSIGDVTGHGLEAAVAMSEIRRTIRAASIGRTSPADILNHVDEVLSAEGIGMATAVVGLYDTSSGILRYASAGHPAPILLSPSGRAVTLPAGGLLLGLGMKPASSDWTATITKGSACYFFTDGLLEYGRDIISGERTLMRGLETLQQTSAQAPSASDLHEYIFERVHNTDDAATLVMRRLDAPGDALTLSYSSLPQFAPIAREALKGFAIEAGLSGDDMFNFLTATGEALANAIEHGEQDPGVSFDLKAELRDKTIAVQVHSRGHWRAFTQREDRGRGIPIMRACTSALEIGSTHDATTVTLRFQIPG